MSSQGDFTLTKTEAKPLVTETKFITVCGATLTVADIEAALVADGCVSPNDANNPPEIVAFKSTVVPKGKTVLDNANGDVEVVATGETVVYTDSKGDPHNIDGGDSRVLAVCVSDDDCNLVPDKEIDDAESWAMPTDSCVTYAITYA